MDAARIIPQQLVPVTLECEPENDSRPVLLDHADYIRVCAWAAVNRRMRAAKRDLTMREWRRMVYAVACFGNLKLAETTDSVEAMDAGQHKMMAAAAALEAGKR